MVLDLFCNALLRSLYSTACKGWNFSSLPRYTSLVLMVFFPFQFMFFPHPSFFLAPSSHTLRWWSSSDCLFFSFEACVIGMDYYVFLAHWHAGFALAWKHSWSLDSFVWDTRVCIGFCAGGCSSGTFWLELRGFGMPSQLGSVKVGIISSLIPLRIWCIFVVNVCDCFRQGSVLGSIYKSL